MKPILRPTKALVGITLILVISVTWYLKGLESTVTDRFEKRRFSIPSSVFARSLQLFRGQKITINQLLRELKELGYRHQESTKHPGTYHRPSPRSITLHTRGFQFWDKKTKPQVIQLTFNHQSITRLDSQEANSVIVRLGPLKIGGMYPDKIEDRLLIGIESVPERLVETLLLVEDRQFHEHRGVSFAGIGRAFLENIKAGRIVQGGSTLTQQLVKNLFLYPEQTLGRKIKEVLMAGILEYHYSKREILETYLNQVYFGQNGRRALHGFGLASVRFFDKSIEDLEPQEMALLVGMLKGPAYFDPFRHQKRTLKRRNLVLGLMRAQNLLTEKEWLLARQKPLGTKKKVRLQLQQYPDYIDLVHQQIKEFYPEDVLEQEGLRIFTNMDPLTHHNASRSLLGFIRDRPQAQLSGAMIVLDRSAGTIKTLIGRVGPGGSVSSFNRALSARRPIGSLLKPVIYLTALEKGFHLGSDTFDEPMSIPQKHTDSPWEPQNFDGQSHGKVPLVHALANSYNLATIWLGQELGIPSIKETITRLGIQPPDHNYPSMLLGTIEMSPLDVASMYHPISAEGFRIPLRSIQAITTAEGALIQDFPIEMNQVIHEKNQYQILTAMTQTMNHGTGKSFYQWAPKSFRIAGKTGTTQDGRDSWFTGITEDAVSVVWIGRDNNAPTSLTGATGALRVFTNFHIHQKLKSLNLANIPEGLVLSSIDESGEIRVGCSTQGNIPIPKEVAATSAHTDCDRWQWIKKILKL